LVELPAQEGYELLGGDGAERREQRGKGVVDGQVADERHQEENGRKEREQKVKGELRRQSQAIVMANLANSARDNV
jgi:hypothetical protein